MDVPANWMIDACEAPTPQSPRLPGLLLYLGHVPAAVDPSDV